MFETMKITSEHPAEPSKCGRNRTVIRPEPHIDVWNEWPFIGNKSGTAEVNSHLCLLIETEVFFYAFVGFI